MTFRDNNTREWIPICKPQLPRLENLESYYRDIDQNGWYSNFGPLEARLTDRFAELLRLNSSQVLLTSSGTSAIVAALNSVALAGQSICLTASWTFVASAVAIMSARLLPHFCDVDPTTWTLDPNALRRRSDLHRVAAVLVTCPFGEPVNTAAWDEFTEATGIPVVIDAAAAFGALQTGALVPGKAIVVISLHATKTLGIGEGGLLLGTDESQVRLAKAAVNFGFHGSRVAQVIGLNGKLSEYAAAVGHAALDIWPQQRQEWIAALELYEARKSQFETSGKLRLPSTPYPVSTVSWMASSAAMADAAEEALRNCAVDTRRWWGGGCHTHPAYSHFSRDRLPVTDFLGSCCVGLPIWRGFPEQAADRIAAAFAQFTNGYP